MELGINHFKRALKEEEPQIGLWVDLADSYSAEILATLGFDWLLLDGEHGPNDVRSLLSQLQAIAPYEAQGISHPIIRPVEGSPAVIKQMLDIGAQTLLIPMVDTKEEAELMVKAVTYPPKGIRGVGSYVARAAKWGQIDGYTKKASDEICLLIQVETAQGVNNLAEIAAVEGIDGIFIGPADLSASLGYIGEPTHPEVQRAIAQAFQTIKASGKAAGILYADVDEAKKYLAMGFDFVAVGVDTALLVQGGRALLQHFKP